MTSDEKGILWGCEFLDNTAVVVRACRLSSVYTEPLPKSVLLNHTEVFTNFSSFCVCSNNQGLPFSICSHNNPDFEPVLEGAEAAACEEVPLELLRAESWGSRIDC